MLKNAMWDNTVLNHLQRTLQSCCCTSLKGAALCDFEVRCPPSTNEVYTTLRSLAHVPCWAATMPRRHFQCCSNVVWLPPLFTEVRGPLNTTCFELFRVWSMYLEKAQEIDRNGGCSGCTWLPFQRCVFAPLLQEVTRWHTNFVQRGSFDLAISGGQTGVGNIGNFIRLGWLCSWNFMDEDEAQKISTYFHTFTARVWMCRRRNSAFCGLFLLALWESLHEQVSCYTGSRSAILLSQRFLHFVL